MGVVMSLSENNKILDIDRTKTGLRLKQLRIGCKLKQRDVAEVLDVTQNTISSIECGAVNLTMENAIILSQLYDCKLDDFITLKKEEYNDEQK